MRLGTTVLGAAIGGIAGLAHGKGDALKFALYGGGIGFVASLLGVQASSSIVVGEEREDMRRREERDRERERRGGRYDDRRRVEHHEYARHAMQPQHHGCECWANVDVFGNIQDHQTCYPTHQDAAQKTNGFPGTPSDTQGGDHPSWVACPQT